MGAALGVAALGIGLGVGLAAGPAAAQGDGQAQVYDPQPPPDSAYIRFVNALGTAVEVKPAFMPPQRLGAGAAERVGAYVVAEKVAGRELLAEASAGGQSARLSLRAEPGSFNTVLIRRGADGAIVAAPVVEETAFNRARARIAFYNAAPDCAAAGLRIGAAGPVIFEQVAADATRSRSVNPVAAELRAHCGDEAAPDFPLPRLEAGGMYSIWLMRPEGEALAAFVTRDTTAPWRR